jgi:hypothetical protein
MSALPPKADIRERVLDVRFGPGTDFVMANTDKYSLDTALQFLPNSAQPMNFLCLTVVSDLPTSMTLIGKS